MPPKIYKHVGRLTVWRGLRKRFIRNIKWALKVNPGDLINDCTGLNRYVISSEPQKQTFRHGGWIIYNVDFEVSDDKDAKQGGYCSLLNCGVGPALDRDVCEKEILIFMNHWMTDPKAGAHWFGGFDNPKYKDLIEICFRKWEALKKGEHICDERGILLPEFRTRSQSF